MDCVQKKSRLIWLIRSLILSAGVVGSQYVASSRSTVLGQEAETSDARIADLISQLGATSFQQREQASSELLHAGELAITALTAAESGFSPEVRQRAAMVRKQIESDVFRKLSENFLRDTELTQSHALPGWKSFSDYVGTPRSAKILFLAMVREQPAIAKLIGSLADERQRLILDHAAIADCEQRLKLVSGQCAERMRTDIFKNLIDPDVGNTVALMLSATVLDGQVSTEVHSLVYITIIKSSFRESLRRPGYRECLLKLMGAWIPRTPDSFADYVLALSKNDGVSEGVSVARRVLAGKFEPRTNQAALECLAKFGSESDIPLAEKFLSDVVILGEFIDDGRENRGILGENAAPPGGLLPNLPADPKDARRMVVRIGDLALAVCMKLSHQDLTRVFPRMTNSPDQDLRTDGLAFPADKPALREYAFKLWHDSRIAKQPPPAS